MGSDLIITSSVLNPFFRKIVRGSVEDTLNVSDDIDLEAGTDHWQ